MLELFEFIYRVVLKLITKIIMVKLCIPNNEKIYIQNYRHKAIYHSFPKISSPLVKLTLHNKMIKKNKN